MCKSHATHWALIICKMCATGQCHVQITRNTLGAYHMQHVCHRAVSCANHTQHIGRLSYAACVPQGSVMCKSHSTHWALIICNMCATGQCHVQITLNTLGAYHMQHVCHRALSCANHTQHIGRLSCATCVPQGSVMCKSHATHWALVMCNMCATGQCHVQITRNTLGAYHVQHVCHRAVSCANHTQHIGRLSYATCVPHSAEGQLSCYV